MKKEKRDNYLFIIFIAMLFSSQCLFAGEIIAVWNFEDANAVDGERAVKWHCGDAKEDMKYSTIMPFKGEFCGIQTFSGQKISVFTRTKPFKVVPGSKIRVSYYFRNPFGVKFTILFKCYKKFDSSKFFDFKNVKSNRKHIFFACNSKRRTKKWEKVTKVITVDEDQNFFSLHVGISKGIEGSLFIDEIVVEKID
jgi:hypothetical protein